MESAGLETAKLLGTANGQLILAVGLVFAVIVAVWLGRALFNEMKTTAAERLDWTVKKIDSDNNLAAAIKAQTELSRTMLDELRGRR